MEELVESKITEIPLVRCIKKRKRKRCDYQFMNELFDELLLEIFIRLPDSRSAIRCSSVCKRWLSLISSTSNPQFIPNFNHRHRDSPVPYALLFHSHNNITYQVCSDESKNLLDSSDFLSFLPETTHMPTVFASCNDLLLVRTAPALHYLICNPFTKQWTRIPEPSSSPGITRLPNRYGLACGPNRVGFKVVLFRLISEFMVQIFSSDTWKWGSQITISSTPEKMCMPCINRIAAACNDEKDGSTLHWLDTDWSVPGALRGLVAYSPFDTETECRYVDAPHWLKLHENNVSFALGVFRGRLRVAVLSPGRLRICDLQRDWSWSLTHNIKFPIHREPSYVFDIHPSEDDVVFFRCGRLVVSFKFPGPIDYKTVGLLPYQMKLIATSSILLPLWPTRLPSLTIDLFMLLNG